VEVNSEVRSQKSEGRMEKGEWRSRKEEGWKRGGGATWLCY